MFVPKLKVQHFSVGLFPYCYLFLLILIRELIKDLENIEGDLIADYNTIPVVFGEKIEKIIISIYNILK